MKTCPYCGHAGLPEDAQFCSSCGRPVVQAAPAPQPAPALQPTAAERWGLLPCYVLAYVYVRCLGSMGNVVMTVFAALFTLAVELVYARRRAGWEPYVWLACMWVCLMSCAWLQAQVWGALGLLAAHLFAVYYVLARSGGLLDGRTSSFLPLDGVNALLIAPFGSFFLRIRVLWRTLSGLWTGKGRSRASALAAVAVAAVLLWAALSLLARADATFSMGVQGLLRLLDSEHLVNFLFRLLLSLPVGAYLYGLVFGCARRAPARVQAQRAGLDRWRASLRRVPDGVWCVLLAIFAAVYAVFFCIQGRYLFGAFGRSLPAGFTVAEYARQGFFELCRVMALNFALAGAVWLSGARRSRGERGMLTVLLLESVLFAVTAASKLWLYIDCFGFTPLRLQSAWLIVSLFAGCVCALISLWSGRKTLRAWAILSALTFSALCCV